MRNTSLSIAKGIAIILMCAGHAEGPGIVINFIYLFHMPLFFIAAGYFFSKKYVTDPWLFCKKRFKGLYIPFVKWSVFFLLIHNLMFKIGILNEQYGNWENGVTHPYTWHEGCQRLVNIVFSMGGYDEFLAGAFWFFRALLVASIVFLVLYLLLHGKHKWLGDNGTLVAIALLALGFAWFKVANNLKIVTLVQGGIRDTWGVFFFAMGALYRRHEHRIPKHWVLTLIYAGVILGGCFIHCHGLILNMNLQDVATIPLTGCIGFMMVHNISTWIDKHDNWLKRTLVYCGDNTLYVFIFHIISFKLVSALKIMYYGLDWGQIGCHMVIHHNSKTDLFWVLYAIVGTAVPLVWIYFYRKIKTRWCIAKKK